MSLPRVLVVEPMLRRRLELVGALSSVFEVEPLAEAESPARATRRGRFALAVLSTEPDPDESLRVARALRADFSAPPAVLLVDPVRRLSAPAALLRPEQAQGLWRGEIDPRRLCALATACLQGRGGVEEGAAPVGLVRRLLARRWGR